jgi:uncharacterized repeat protein (TIGR01451 family)
MNISTARTQTGTPATFGSRRHGSRLLQAGLFRSVLLALLLIGSLCGSGSASAQTAAVMNVRTVQFGFADNDSSGNVTLGDRLDYSVTATNTGSGSLTNVQVNDNFGATNTCATVAVNAACVATSSHVVTAADVTGGEVINEGRASSNETNDVSNTLYTQVFGNQMTIIVYLNFDNSQPPTVGDVFHYSVIATNQNSTGSLTNVHVSDPTLSPSTSATCATLAAGATCVLNGDYTVTSADVSAGSVTNTGSASSDQVPGPLSYSVSQSVFAASGFVEINTTNALASIADNDHSGTVTVGDVLTYTSTATNTGTIAATNVQLSSPLLTPGSVTCASVAPNASCVLTGTHTVTSADATSGQIVYEPNESDGTGHSGNDGNPVTTPVATAGGAAMSVFVDINNLVDTDHSGTTTAGDTVQFVVTAVNAGSVPLTNVQVSDPQTTPGSTTCASVAVGATCVLNGTYTILASDVSSSAKIVITGSATSTQVPGPESFSREIRIDGNTLDTVLLQTVAGDMQSGAPGSTLPIPLKVRLVDGTGNAVPGFPIQFWIIGGGNAHVTSALVTTDSLGEASTQLVLPSTPGSVTVVACTDPNRGSCAPSTSFTAFATGAAVTPAALTIVSGNNQVLPINTTSAPLVVQLMNNGLPVVNATINWSGTNATLASTTTLTDANGRASNTATVQAVGAASVSASSATPAAGPVSFALNGGLATLAGLTPAQTAVATALDNACPALSALGTPTPAQQDLLAQCQALSSAAGAHPEQVRSALDQMLPHTALLQTNAGILVASTQFDNIKARIAALRSGGGGRHFGGLSFNTSDGMLPIGKFGDALLGLDTGKTDDRQKQEIGSGFDRWGFFASGTFSRGSADPRQATPGYGFHTNGITAGVDYRFNAHAIVGVSAGYANYSSAVDVVGGGLDTHGWSLSAYSTFFTQNSWYLDGVLSWGNNTYDINRRILYTLVSGAGTTTVNQTATSSSGGNTLAGALTFGRDVAKGPWSFGPYFRGTWTHTSFDAYQETLKSSLPGNGLGLDVQSRNVNSIASVLGAKVNYASSQSWGVMMPHAEVEWEHEYRNSPDSITASFLQDPTATPIQLNGDPVDTNFFRLGLGLSFVFTGGRSGFVYYEKTLGLTGITQDTIALGFRMEF